MKKALSITTLIAVAGLLVAQPCLAAGRSFNRQFNQNQRIFQGINSGELTRGEARRLLKQQHRIRKYTHMARADGNFTRKERLRLERHQNKASHTIYRLKHNNRYRY